MPGALLTDRVRRWLPFWLALLLLLVVLFRILPVLNPGKENGSVDVPLAAHQLNFLIDTAGKPTFGSPEAAAELVVFSDFSCPHCFKLFQELERLRSRREYHDRFRLVFVCNPINPSNNGLLLANVSKFAHRSGKFWEVYPVLYQLSGVITEENVCRLLKVELPDTVSLRSYLNAPSLDLLSDMRIAQNAAIRAVPACVVNGSVYYGALTGDQLVTLLGL